MYKHYVTIDSEGYIISLFSDALKESLESDILLRESESRHAYLGDYDYSYNLYEDRRPTYKLIDGEVVKSEPKPLTRDEKLIPIRANRNQLLSATDFMVLPDIPFTIEEVELIKTYRQQLRDITKTIDVDNPIYPSKPV